MIIKIIGSIIVIFSASMVGFLIASAYRDRPVELREIQAFLQMLETEISYASTPLSEALDNIASKMDSKTKHFLENIKKFLKAEKGYTAAEAWEKALLTYYTESSLNNEDKAILSNLGKYIGRSGAKDQVKHLRLAITQLKQQEKKAEVEKGRNERIWKYMGVLTGILFVLLTI